jgi:membrane-bound lytic murein transglycosylase F
MARANRSPEPGRPAWALLACLLLAGGDAASEARASRSLAEIRASGTLVVLTRNAPTTWYIGRDEEPTGPEHDMARAFAAHLGVRPRFVVKRTIQEIVAGIENGEGDLAAAGLTITAERSARFRFGPSYQTVTQQLVCRRDRTQPEEIADLIGLDIRIISASSYSERLQALQREHPGLAWTETAHRDTEQLLHAVWQRDIDCTVADSNIVDINRRYYPELTAPLDLAPAEELGWMMRRERADLQRAVKEWFAAYAAHGRLAQLHERYYGFVEVFDYVDIRRYMRRIRTRLPRYRDYFRQAAARHDLPFALLAAQGYQESHWRANARSPTGVRGIMMLTLSTARALGVTNRLDARQSIFGGAKYLARLKRRLPAAVREPDRTWLALAAYNLGYAHLRDARQLARERGLNPDRWSDLKEVLPLLQDPRYYERLAYGYARGTEAVRYVQRIREYRHVLENALNEAGAARRAQGAAAG